MSDVAGLATAKANQVPAEVVSLSPETVPEGHYFIGCSKGLIYKLALWMPGGRYTLWQWNEPSLAFVRQYPEPDGVNCKSFENHGSANIIVIGPDPVGSALSEPQPTGEPESLPDPFAGSEDVTGLDCTWSPPTWKISEPVEPPDEASSEEPIPSSQPVFPSPPEEVVGADLPTPAEAEEPDEVSLVEIEPKPLAEGDLPEELVAQVESIVWPRPGNKPTKADYIRALGKICWSFGTPLPLEKIKEWAVKAGVWADDEIASRNIQPTVRYFVGANPGFSLSGSVLYPPEAPFGEGVAPEVVEPTKETYLGSRKGSSRLPLVRAMDDGTVAGKGAETEEGIRRCLGLLGKDAEVEVILDVHIQVRPRKLTPEIVEALGLLDEEET